MGTAGIFLAVIPADVWSGGLGWDRSFFEQLSVVLVFLIIDGGRSLFHLRVRSGFDRARRGTRFSDWTFGDRYRSAFCGDSLIRDLCIVGSAFVNWLPTRDFLELFPANGFEFALSVFCSGVRNGIVGTERNGLRLQVDVFEWFCRIEVTSWAADCFQLDLHVVGTRPIIKAWTKAGRWRFSTQVRN